MKKKSVIKGTLFSCTPQIHLLCYSIYSTDTIHHHLVPPDKCTLEPPPPVKDFHSVSSAVPQRRASKSKAIKSNDTNLSFSPRYQIDLSYFPATNWQSRASSIPSGGGWSVTPSLKTFHSHRFTQFGPFNRVIRDVMRRCGC